MRKKFVASSHLGDRPSFSVMHIFTVTVFYACKFLLRRFDQFVYLKHSRKSDFLNFDFLSGDPTCTVDFLVLIFKMSLSRVRPCCSFRNK